MSPEMAAALDELLERMRRAERNLLTLAADTDYAKEVVRLEAKASGLHLAAGYVRELRRGDWAIEATA